MHKKFLIIILLLISGACSFSKEENKYIVDMVAYSYNRPLQLYALLESLEKYVHGLGKITVIYRASDDRFEAAYEKVKQRFDAVVFKRQAHQTARQDFKQMTLDALLAGKARYIMFAVDDDIVIDHVDVRECARALKATGAYGFYLRLGLHVTECYTENRHQGVPQDIHEAISGIYQWTFSEGNGDWGYPNSVDMTIFKKSEIEEKLTTLWYTTPNTLEGQWAGRADRSKTGLCFRGTKIINTPLNLVQTDYAANRHSHAFTVEQLLEKFNEGLKIDLDPLYKMQNVSAHINYEPQFIRR